MKKKSGWINCIWAAFSTYSRIPVPTASWDAESLRWQICCFPLVGLAIGLIWCAAGIILTLAGFYPFLSGVLLCALPMILTGGIHMDGFLDTTDAVHSWKSPGERQEILKDPHIGAFAMIYGTLYLLTASGICAQIAANVQAAAMPQLTLTGQTGNTLPSVIRQVPSSLRQLTHVSFFMMIPCFILSRILSALSVVFFPKARKEGMLRSTADASDKRAGKVLLIELLFGLLIFVIEAWAFRKPAILLLPLLSGLVFAYYYRMVMRQFGGISGDLAGWFLQVTELACLALIVFL